MSTYDVVTSQSYNVGNSSVRYRLLKLSITLMEGEEVFVGPEESATSVGEAELSQVESQES